MLQIMSCLIKSHPSRYIKKKPLMFYHSVDKILKLKNEYAGIFLFVHLEINLERYSLGKNNEPSQR